MVKDIKLQNVLLEEQIDEILDAQIVCKQEIYSAERQIGRVMKKTETLLRDGERLIRARLNESE